LGQVVITSRISKGSQLKNIDISSLAAGMYVIKLTCNDAVQVKKLMVQ
jgi:hypothetical protein